MFEIRFPKGARFYFLHSVETVSEILPASCPLLEAAVLQVLKRARGEAYHSPYCVEVKNVRAIDSLAHLS
jgi:hypothetical protein